MTEEGDTFLPMTGWTIVAFKGIVGFEASWSETEQDFRAGKREYARLLISPDEAEALAAKFIEQARIARQRAQPN